MDPYTEEIIAELDGHRDLTRPLCDQCHVGLSMLLFGAPMYFDGLGCLCAECIAKLDVDKA